MLYLLYKCLLKKNFKCMCEFKVLFIQNPSTTHSNKKFPFMFWHNRNLKTLPIVVKPIKSEISSSEGYRLINPFRGSMISVSPFWKAPFISPLMSDENSFLNLFKRIFILVNYRVEFSDVFLFQKLSMWRSLKLLQFPQRH